MAVRGASGSPGWRFHPDCATPKHGATLDKPQTKAFFAHGSWWAVLARPEEHGRAELALFELVGTKAWRDAGTTVSADPQTTADATYDGESLWVATRAPEVGIVLARYRFMPDERRWARDPAGVWQRHAVTPSVSVAVATDRTVWLTYCSAGLPYVTGAHTEVFPDLPPPSPIPGATGTLWDVDLSAALPVDDTVGILWSDQGTETFSFAVRDRDGGWQVEVAATGGLVADDHIAARTFGGRCYFAVKTSRDDDPACATDDALILLLVREPDRNWHAHRVVSIEHPVTRPIPIIEPETGRIHVLYTYGANPGARTIREKVARLDDLKFSDGPGEIVIEADGARINDVTSGREPLTAATGGIVLASDGLDRRYYFRMLEADPGSRTLKKDGPPVRSLRGAPPQLAD